MLESAPTCAFEQVSYQTRIKSTGNRAHFLVRFCLAYKFAQPRAMSLSTACQNTRPRAHNSQAGLIGVLPLYQREQHLNLRAVELCCSACVRRIRNQNLQGSSPSAVCVPFVQQDLCTQRAARVHRGGQGVQDSCQRTASSRLQCNLAPLAAVSAAVAPWPLLLVLPHAAASQRDTATLHNAAVVLQGS